MDGCRSRRIELAKNSQTYGLCCGSFEEILALNYDSRPQPCSILILILILISTMWISSAAIVIVESDFPRHLWMASSIFCRPWRIVSLR